MGDAEDIALQSVVQSLRTLSEEALSHLLRPDAWAVDAGGTVSAAETSGWDRSPALGRPFLPSCSKTWGVYEFLQGNWGASTS